MRKKNNILRETMEKMEQQFKSIGHQQSNAFASNGYNDFESLPMESAPWDELSLVNNISLEAEGLMHRWLMLIPATTTAMTT